MRKIILSFAACLALAAYGQKPVQDTRAMDTFIDQLMGKMTLDEKIGQLNLSGGGVPGILSGSEGADRRKSEDDFLAAYHAQLDLYALAISKRFAPKPVTYKGIYSLELGKLIEVK